MAGKRITFGNKNAKALCQLSAARQLDFLADGLPIILASARSFWSAAETLKDNRREADVLCGFATEEAAKILIFVDLVRCPAKLRVHKTGHMVALFYDHLSRLLYAEAQHWKPTHLAELRGYVNNSRDGHYLEGSMGEYIVPNATRYRREAALYADIESYEDGVLSWHDPLGRTTIIAPRRPLALGLAEAMAAVGMFTRRGLQAVSDVFSALEFAELESHHDARHLTGALFERLDSEKLVSGEATEDHGKVLLNAWQLPMYNLDFSEIPSDLEELNAQRDAAFWAEVGQ